MTYSEKEARELVVQAGLKLVKEGLVARTWGNISARVSDTHFVITPSGLAYDRLSPEKLVMVRISDCSYEGEIKPSSEKGIHAAAYRINPDTGFVIHTHQDYASCIGIGGKALDNIDNDILGKRVPCAEYGMPSTKKLKKNVESAIQNNPEAKAIFMKHHGAVCMAPDYETAFDVALALEHVCRRKYEEAVTITEYIPADAGELMEKLRAASLDKHFLIESSPEVQAIAAQGKTLHPHLDDLAQIAGVNIRCAEKNASAILKALDKRAAVLVRGIGAVCCTEDEGDLEAVAAIMRKSCMTALYAEKCGAESLSLADRIIMRFVYTMKYSKKKTES